jgi:hypothetical protein
MSQQIERLERHVGISNEALAVFVRFWLTGAKHCRRSEIDAKSARITKDPPRCELPTVRIAFICRGKRACSIGRAIGRFLQNQIRPALGSYFSTVVR